LIRRAKRGQALGFGVKVGKRGRQFIHLTQAVSAPNPRSPWPIQSHPATTATKVNHPGQKLLAARCDSNWSGPTGSASNHSGQLTTLREIGTNIRRRPGSHYRAQIDAVLHLPLG
jgi:hypothetical protein